MTASAGGGGPGKLYTGGKTSRTKPVKSETETSSDISRRNRQFDLRGDLMRSMALFVYRQYREKDAPVPDLITVFNSWIDFSGWRPPEAESAAYAIDHLRQLLTINRETLIAALQAESLI